MPGWSINHPGMWYPIDAGYPAGDYTFTGKVGEHPNVAVDQSGFPFVKEGTDHIAEFVPYPVEGAPNPFEDIRGEAPPLYGYQKSFLSEYIPIPLTPLPPSVSIYRWQVR